MLEIKVDNSPETDFGPGMFVVCDGHDFLAAFVHRADAELFVRAKERQNARAFFGFASAGMPSAMTGEELAAKIQANMREELKQSVLTNGQITIALPAPQSVQVNVVDHNGVRLLEIPPLGEAVTDTYVKFGIKDGQCWLDGKPIPQFSGMACWLPNASQDERYTIQAGQLCINDPQPDVVIGDE